jgi:hypothetical protein
MLKDFDFPWITLFKDVDDIFEIFPLDGSRLFDHEEWNGFHQQLERLLDISSGELPSERPCSIFRIAAGLYEDKEAMRCKQCQLSQPQVERLRDYFIKAYKFRLINIIAHDIASYSHHARSTSMLLFFHKMIQAGLADCAAHATLPVTDNEGEDSRKIQDLTDLLTQWVNSAEGEKSIALKNLRDHLTKEGVPKLPFLSFEGIVCNTLSTLQATTPDTVSSRTGSLGSKMSSLLTVTEKTLSRLKSPAALWSQETPPRPLSMRPILDLSSRHARDKTSCLGSLYHCSASSVDCSCIIAFP